MRAMVQKSSEKEQKHQHIRQNRTNFIENLYNNRCSKLRAEVVWQAYRDAARNSLRSGKFLACHASYGS
ncbi:hypothetical protein TNCV_1621021 [Trichonephila clavipes]|nr:hypothetical protein TNCV_1621021 [Trichonephila clavipes]